ncbi:MAG: hypothetical protein IJN15_02680 [Clostridia bacterium]|nr:hypothetical protein [Clostridia bacterium]
MVNEEYIKSLEERIRTLEKFIELIKLEDKQCVVFNGCNIGPVVLEKCKKTTLANNQMENGVFGGFINNVTYSSIHNFESVHPKVKLKNCSIKNHSEE